MYAEKNAALSGDYRIAERHTIATLLISKRSLQFINMKLSPLFGRTKPRSLSLSHFRTFRIIRKNNIFAHSVNNWRRDGSS